MTAAGWEDAHDVGAPADLLVQSLLGVVGADLAPVLDGEGAEGQDVVGGVEHVADDVAEARRWSACRRRRPNWAQVASRSACSKMERTKVAIMGQLPLGDA